MEFAEALQDYNRQVTDVFSQYLATVAAELENDRREENKLPLSGIGGYKIYPTHHSITFSLPTGKNGYLEPLFVCVNPKYF